MTQPDAPASERQDDPEFLARVMAEIDEEVRARRASGDLPPRIERELDELFLQFSPVAGRSGSLREALRMVDSATFIDPVVPVESAKSGGAVVKRGLRQLSLWYVGYVTHQVSQFATAVSRTLHLVNDEMRSLREQLEAQRIPPADVVEVPWAHRADAWWVPQALGALGAAPGRVLHSACGDGWLVGACAERGIDAYGVDPRPATEVGVSGARDLREEAVLGHLRASAPAALGGLVLTGVVEGMAPGERAQLLDLALDRLAPGGVLVVHSLSPSAWAADDLPVAADLAFGHPLRPASWRFVLEKAGFEVAVEQGDAGRDYLVVATLRTGAPTVR
jgi:SAM-dependent methyltransferase